MKTPNENGGFLGFLYGNAFGRMILKLLTARWISKLAGAFLSCRISKLFISRFVKNNNIDLDEYYADDFRSFNDCFCRKIKEDRRPVDMDPTHLISPCDSYLTATTINEGTVLFIKQSQYTVSDLLGGDAVAEKYKDGLCLVFRLCVEHYHRYHYPDNGTKGENTFIEGKLHTVRPIALEACPVFAQNCREYTVMETENFGTVTQVEVGAMMVGRIKNLHGAHTFKRGEEKGMFLFGGSTVVLLLEKGKATLKDEILEASARGEETPVKMGEHIGCQYKA